MHSKQIFFTAFLILSIISTFSNAGATEAEESTEAITANSKLTAECDIIVIKTKPVLKPDVNRHRVASNPFISANKWLQRHQSMDGRWDFNNYEKNSSSKIKCSDNMQNIDEDKLCDVIATSFSILDFLGDGYDHKAPSYYKDTVEKGINWLLEVQKLGLGNGEVNKWPEDSNYRVYSQAIATMALSEAYGMTLDPKLKEAVQNAVDCLLDWQLSEGGVKLGWREIELLNKEKNEESIKLGRNNLFLTGWVCMALKSAKSAGLDTGDGMKGCENLLISAYKAANPNITLETLKALGDPENLIYPPAKFPYEWYSKTNTTSKEKNLECTGALMAIYLGHTYDSPLLGSLVTGIMQNDYPKIKQEQLDIYRMYYGTLALFQTGRRNWHEWNSVSRDFQVKTQVVHYNSCSDGSWKTKGTKFYGYPMNKIIATAMQKLSLQIYYAYHRLRKHKRVK